MPAWLAFLFDPHAPKASPVPAALRTTPWHCCTGNPRAGRRCIVQSRGPRAGQEMPPAEHHGKYILVHLGWLVCDLWRINTASNNTALGHLRHVTSRGRNALVSGRCSKPVVTILGPVAASLTASRGPPRVLQWSGCVRPVLPTKL
jgi:hypothetical protein